MSNEFNFLYLFVLKSLISFINRILFLISNEGSWIVYLEAVDYMYSYLFSVFV